MTTNGHAPGRAPGAAMGGLVVCARTRCEHTPTPYLASTGVNPWRTTATRMSDEELAAWLADLRIVEHDAAGDDPASASTREIAELMRAAAERELALRRHAGADKPESTGGRSREHNWRLRELIRQRLDLVALITEDVPDLRRCGSTWRGRCPLCGTTNPTTLTVWRERGRWRCWRCGLGGDAVAWLLATRPQLDFRSALTYAAQRAGLPLSETVAWPSRRRNRQEPRIRLEGGKVVAG